jgi:hypothetical protein
MKILSFKFLMFCLGLSFFSAAFAYVSTERYLNSLPYRNFSEKSINPIQEYSEDGDGSKNGKDSPKLETVPNFFKKNYELEKMIERDFKPEDS